jgi:hypothetical protein
MELKTLFCKEIFQVKGLNKGKILNTCMYVSLLKSGKRTAY